MLLARFVLSFGIATLIALQPSPALPCWPRSCWLRRYGLGAVGRGSACRCRGWESSCWRYR